MQRVKVLLTLAAAAALAALLARRASSRPMERYEADVDDGRPAGGAPLELSAG